MRPTNTSHMNTEEDTFDALKRLPREQVFDLFRKVTNEYTQVWSGKDVRNFFLKHGWTMAELNNSRII